MDERNSISRLQAGDPAPDLTLLDASGDTVVLSEEWPNGPTLLTFLRHFGWLFCREWLAQLELHKEDFEAAGLQVIGVGMGEPKHARHFCGRLAPGVSCLTDETTDAYHTYGLQQGAIGQLASLSVMRAAGRAVARGHMQGRAIGDAKMLPGTFIIDREGIVRYAYYSAHAGDHPNIDELIAVTKTLNK